MYDKLQFVVARYSYPGPYPGLYPGLVANE